MFTGPFCVCVCVLCMVWCMMCVHRSFLCGVCVCVVHGVVYDVCSQVLFVWCVVYGVVYDVSSQILFVWCVCCAWYGV